MARARHIPILVLSCLLLPLNPGCSGPTRSGAPEFSAMEIHYTRAGGWTHTATLDIDGLGFARACRLEHASLDTSARVSTLLTPAEQDRLASLFVGFGAYGSYYEPDPWHTDGNHHTVRFVYEGVADTVRVYEPERADLPVRLRLLIGELESLWQLMIFPQD